jgi:predicted SAM-dependent methyltransferase
VSTESARQPTKYPKFVYVFYNSYKSASANINRELFYLSPVNRLRISKLKKATPLKLNLGCGKVKYKGWINIDLQPNADIVMDIRKNLPFEDNSVDLVYNEHLIEHLTFQESSKFLNQIYRCLKIGGTVRVATPDLDYIVDKYFNNWNDQEWLRTTEYGYIKTKGNMINVSFREWEHKYLFNEEDLRIHLVNAGFKSVERCSINQSKNPELSGLETRSDSKLIIEAIK